ncbi:MAG: hypothetical protein EXQ57_10585 [Bryobacterales bacterium]|nr:hypothetical protein [Bryobacterales bacterium]
MPAANSIDEVIDALTVIIERAKTERSRLGYFPALYRRVTVYGRTADGANGCPGCKSLLGGL